MAKAAHLPPKGRGTIPPSRHRTHESASPKNLKDGRAPLQILKSTKEWLDQIIEERKLRSYDEAIMFLITERQQHMPSDSGVFSEIAEYTCSGED